MSIEKFEDVISWQKGKELFLILSILYKDEKNYAFKDQLLRAALSITNNIAEGFDRGSDKELRQFLIIARGSCAEVRSMLIIGRESHKATFKESNDAIGLTREISRLLSGFILKLSTVDRKPETSSL